MNALADEILNGLLADDAPCGDLTTWTLAIGAGEGSFAFAARQPMRLCGSEEAARLCQLAGLRCRLDAASGDELVAGQPILHAEGSVSALHLAWKPAQVLIEWASGIASGAAAIVAAAGGVAVACTRKNPPGTKALAVKAVRAGGASMHRLGLSESLLVFAEHRVFLAEPPAATIARLRAREPEKKIVVEVGDIDTALEWAAADVLQLERFTPAALAALRAALPPGKRPLLAAAGGIRADNAADWVAAGADLLVSSAPYSAPPRDVAVSFCRC